MLGVAARQCIVFFFVCLCFKVINFFKLTKICFLLFKTAICIDYVKPFVDMMIMTEHCFR